MSLDLQLGDIDTCDEMIWNKNFSVNKKSFCAEKPPLHSEVNIYTDGSKLDNRVGSGFVIMRHTYRCNF